MTLAQTVALSCVITGATTAVFTFVFTRLWDVFHMERRYQTNDAAIQCIQDRQQAETDIKTQLEGLNRRMILGNLLMADLAEHAGFSDRVAKYEKALGIRLSDATAHVLSKKDVL